MKQCMDSANLHRRLKKIIRQIQAIDRMIDEDVPCEDILSQINAAKSALHGCGRVVLFFIYRPSPIPAFPGSIFFCQKISTDYFVTFCVYPHLFIKTHTRTLSPNHYYEILSLLSTSPATFLTL